MSRSQPAPLVAIVEQHAGVAGLLDVLLAAEGFRTVQAAPEDVTGGVERLAAFLERHSPRVVLYDIALPYDGSWQTFQQVRQAVGARGCHFVLLTTDPHWNAGRTHAPGSPEVILKPFDVDELVRAVHRALHQP